MAHRSREWDPSNNHAGPSSANSTSPSAFLSRRRSSAAHVPPPAPPPTHPIPRIPVLPPNPYEVYDGMPNNSLSPTFDSQIFHNAIDSQTNPYARPTASSSLAAVAAFSQRNANIPSMNSPDTLSDSPPPSILRSPTRSPVRTRHIVPDRLLLSPSEPRSSERRPSSKSALTKALELARQAVQLDSTNDDPYGAVLAYGKSVALLSEVMERVMRGEDSTDSTRRRGGRRRSVVAQEEEVRRLKNIVRSPLFSYGSIRIKH